MIPQRKYPQTPYAIAEPVSKHHLILLPRYATLRDIQTLKLDAYRAEGENNWELAKQLWIRVNVAAFGSDMEAIKAFPRVAQQQVVSSSSSPGNLRKNRVQAKQWVSKTLTNWVGTLLSQQSPLTNLSGMRTTAAKTSEQSAPLKLAVFEFDVVTVDAKGQEIERSRGNVQYFTEDLGKGVTFESAKTITLHPYQRKKVVSFLIDQFL